MASPSTPVLAINAALARGENLIIAPGVYKLHGTIEVTHPDTIVLGLGFPTLIPQDGNVSMRTASVPGVKLSGIIFDAGPRNSPALLEVGRCRPDVNGNRAGALEGDRGPQAGCQAGGGTDDRNDPSLVQDIFFRIGGAEAGQATNGMVVNADNAILDDVWAWRADHGAGAGWNSNRADTGVIVNGDNVTAYGLFVEHYQKYEVVWNGDNGRVVFFQNEMPYDAPDQAAWQHDGVLGYAAYEVADSVTTHEAWGLGSYIYTNVNPSLHASNAFEVPDTAGVKMHDLLTVSLNGAGTIDHVINGIGAPVTPTHQGPSYVLSYP